MKEKREQSIKAFEIQPSVEELNKAFQAMTDMCAVEGNVKDAFFDAAVVGMDLLLALERDGCLHPFTRDSFLTYKPYGSYSSNWFAVSEILLKATEIFKAEPNGKILTELDHSSAAYLDDLGKSLSYYLERRGVIKKGDKPVPGIFYRMGASLITQIVEGVQEHNGDPKLPIELSWGNDGTLQPGHELRGKFQGIQLYHGELERSNRMVNFIRTRFNR